MSNLPVTLYDRPRVALENLFKMDAGAATRAIFAPDTLTPKELTGLQTKYKDDKVAGIFTRLFTNPLFIIGLIASVRYPVHKLVDTFKITDKLGKLAPMVNPTLAKLRNAWSIFRGHEEIPRTMMEISDKTWKFKQKYGEMVHEAVRTYEKTTGHAPTNNFGTLAALKMAGMDRAGSQPMTELAKAMRGSGLKPAGAMMRSINFKGPEQALYNRLDGMFKSVWKNEMKGNPKGVTLVRRVMSKYGIDIGKPLETYWPRQYTSAKGATDILAGVPDEQFGYGALHQVGEKVSARVKPRIPATIGIPDMGELEPMNTQGLMTPGWFDSLKTWITGQHDKLLRQAGGVMHKYKPGSSKMEHWFYQKLRLGGSGDLAARDLSSAIGELKMQGKTDQALAMFKDAMVGAKAVPQYTVNVWRGVDQYISSMAPQVAYTMSGKGIALQGMVAKLDPIRGKFARETFLPILQGKMVPEQIAQNLAWADKKRRLAQWVNLPQVSKWLPEKTKGFLTRALTEDDLGGLSAKSPAASIASYFYMSTLGFNPGPVAKNLLQTFVTTDPLLGTRWKIKALPDVMKGAQNYVKFRTTGGLSDAAAMAKAFPEFVSSGLSPTPLAESFIRGMAGGPSDIGLWTTAAGGSRLARGVEGTKKAMMAAFSASERFNRLISFHGAVAKGTAEAPGAAREGIIALARRVVDETQFTPGVAGAPLGLLKLKPYMRQFMHFPLRYAQFLRDSTVWGSGAPGATGSRQWGTLGRVAMGSTAIYEGARAAGTDLSAGLAFGALPLPQFEQSPFHPFPMVPPALSVAGTGVAALAKGEYNRLGMTAALLVPGGVAARRMYRALAPNYADYKNRTEEGRIPVYSDKGSLVGNYSPMQLVGRAMGMKGMDDQTEQSLVQYLLKQRDQIRAYRREYLEAMYQNDVDGARKIQDEFKKRYPELGEIQVKQSDIKAMEKRKLMSRIPRIMQGFPKQYRPIFEDVVSASLSEDMVQTLRQDPNFANMLSGNPAVEESGEPNLLTGFLGQSDMGYGLGGILQQPQ